MRGDIAGPIKGLLVGLRGATQGLRGSRLGFLPFENMAAARNSHKSTGYKCAVSKHYRANF